MHDCCEHRNDRPSLSTDDHEVCKALLSCGKKRENNRQFFGIVTRLMASWTLGLVVSFGRICHVRVRTRSTAIRDSTIPTKACRRFILATSLYFSLIVMLIVKQISQNNMDSQFDVPAPGLRSEGQQSRSTSRSKDPNSGLWNEETCRDFGRLQQDLFRRATFWIKLYALRQFSTTVTPRLLPIRCMGFALTST